MYTLTLTLDRVQVELCGGREGGTEDRIVGRGGGAESGKGERKGKVRWIQVSKEKRDGGTRCMREGERVSDI